MPPKHPDSAPLQSKKFLAYLISELTSKLLLGAGLYILKDHLVDSSVWFWWWMMTMTICVTFLEVGAILGIAYVDQFVKVAALASKGPRGSSPESTEDEKTEP